MKFEVESSELRVPSTGRTSPLPSPSAPDRPSSGEGGSRQTKTDVRLARCAKALACDHQAGAVEGGRGLEGFVTRRGLATVLKVSVRTVDEMVAAKEITPVRVRGLVRFYLPDVVRELTAAAVIRAKRAVEG